MGMSFARELKMRREMLEQTLLMIKQIKIEIEFLHLPLFEMVQKISRSDSFKSLDYLDFCCKFVSCGADFPIAWQKALNETKLKYTVTEKDKLLLLGESLGSTDAKGQISIINVYERFFDESASLAKEKEKKYSNLYIALGILFGLMMFILII